MPKESPIKIVLDRTCTQDWEGMEPLGTGRHCLSCQKVVVDFSSMSDAALLQYFQRYDEQVCVRFAAGQLDRVIVPKEEARTNWWARAAAGLLLLLGLSQKAEGQIRKAEVLTQQADHQSAANARRGLLRRRKNHQPQLEYRVIIGTLSNFEGAPIVNGLVGLMDSKQTVIGEAVTDAKGCFEIRYPANRYDSLSVSFVFEGQEMIQPIAVDAGGFVKMAAVMPQQKHAAPVQIEPVRIIRMAGVPPKLYNPQIDLPKKVRFSKPR